MTIKEVCERYRISPDTLRYYERMGVIPAVRRTKSGIRDYSPEDLSSVENAICMRSAGVPVEMVSEYMKLCQEGDGTFSARRDLLARAREEVLRHLVKYQRELERLDYKIARYDAALETGELVWDQTFSFDPETGSFACMETEKEQTGGTNP